MTSARLSAGSETSGFRSGIRTLLDVIGPDLRGDRADRHAPPTNLNWIAVLSLIAALALLLVVMGQGAGRRSEDVAPLLFWSGVVLLVVPATLRISWESVARGERLVLLFLLAGGLFYYKSVYSPTSFSEHDEFLHWIATDDLMIGKRLFLSNPLLPVGPDYPALEILTSALVEVTGLSLFVAATLLLAVLRGVFVGAMFLFYERITGSARLSAIACLVYMGCSTFVAFDASFSYESLGIVFCMLSFALDAASKDLPEGPRLRAVGIIVLILAALTVTHHLTAAYAAIYFAAIAILETARRGASRREVSVAIALAVVALALPLAWMWARGNPLAGYLGPVIEKGLKALLARFHDLKIPETNQSIDIPSQPLATRLTTMLGVLLLALGLATGFFRALAMATPVGVVTGWRHIRGLLDRRWSESRIVFLTFLAFGFPISTAFRLTVGGWEIGNRMGTFVFLAVGLVVAVSVVHFWQARAPRDWRGIMPALALALVIMGGVTASSIKPIRGPYRAGADAESVEPMSIETAHWTRDWLGPGNHFIADRVNRLLLGSYGRQDEKINLIDGVSISRIYEAEKLPPDDLYVLAKSDVDFMLVDMRLSRFPSVFGFYFDPWESSNGAPLSAKALLKFDDIDGIARVYDNGWMKIYDVRGLHGRF
jgi:hypothetical protein